MALAQQWIATASGIAARVCDELLWDISMYKFDNQEIDRPQVDLQTARETLVYIRDDLAQLGELRHVAIALQEAISQIEVAEARAKLPGLEFFRNSRFLNQRF